LSEIIIGEDPELRRRLVWLTFFRLAVVSVLFTSTLILGGGGSSDLPAGIESKLLAVSVAGFLGTLAFSLLLRTGRWLGLITYAEIFADVTLAALLVYLTGGSISFGFMFFLGIANAALLMSQRGAILAATVSSGMFGFLRLALNERWVAPPADFLSLPRAAPETLAFGIFLNVAAFFLVAALSSYFVNQLNNKSEQLEARELDYEALADLHQAILASIPSGIATLTPDGALSFINKAGLDIARPWLGEAQPRHLSDLLPGITWPLLGPVSFMRQELEVTPSSGPRWLGLTVSELKAQQRTDATHVVIFQDLTELRRLGEEAQRHERLAAVGRLAAGLAHELRNPLASMSGAVQMLTSTPSSDPDNRRLADIVSSETDRLNRLVTDFLGFARPMPPQMGRLDLADLVGRTLDMLAHSPDFERVRLVSRLGPAEVMGDANQLRQAIWNLLVNAGQATGGKGEVTVEVRSEGSRVVLEVSDDGPGISEADIGRIFEPFFTTKEGGTGLGLPTAEALVRAHQGSLEAQRGPKGGAVFLVVLPRAAIEPAPSVLAGPSMPVAPAHEKDDNPVQAPADPAATRPTKPTPQEA
jgi:two-component system sensor histidine kinase PilS (NtrC family)